MMLKKGIIQMLKVGVWLHLIEDCTVIRCFKCNEAPLKQSITCESCGMCLCMDCYNRYHVRDMVVESK